METLRADHPRIFWVGTCLGALAGAVAPLHRMWHAFPLFTYSGHAVAAYDLRLTAAQSFSVHHLPWLIAASGLVGSLAIITAGLTSSRTAWGGLLIALSVFLVICNAGLCLLEVLTSLHRL